MNKFIHVRNIWIFIATLSVALIAYSIYKSSFEFVAVPKTDNIAKQKNTAKYVRKSVTVILNNIKAQYSEADLISQLEGITQQLRNKIKKADLVERIILERELSLQEIKVENIEQAYVDKIDLLVASYQSLDKLKGIFSVDEKATAQAALVRGDTKNAYELFSKFEYKQRNATEQAAINLGAEAAYFRGKIAQDQIDYRKAYRHYRQAVKYTPDNVQYLLAAAALANNIALYSNAINYYEAALHFVKKAVKKKLLSPNDVRDIWINLGVAWNSKNNSDKAIEYFELVLANDLKAFGENYVNIAADKNRLGWAWETKGELKKAVEYYKQALKLNETNLGITHPSTLLTKDNMDAAIRLLNKKLVDKGNKH